MLGFNRYKGLEDIVYIQPDDVSVSVDVRSQHEDLLDLIYSIDPITGFPSGAYQMFLSEKTSDDIRKFISDYLMNNNQSAGLDLPQDVLDQYNQLPTEFIAQVYPSRYETTEQYETRISEYINQYRQEEDFRRKYDELFGKHNGKVSDA